MGEDIKNKKHKVVKYEVTEEEWITPSQDDGANVKYKITRNKDK